MVDRLRFSEQMYRWTTLGLLAMSLVACTPVLAAPSEANISSAGFVDTCIVKGPEDAYMVFPGEMSERDAEMALGPDANCYKADLRYPKWVEVHNPDGSRTLEYIGPSAKHSGLTSEEAEQIYTSDGSGSIIR